jgi:hypothetical protein
MRRSLSLVNLGGSYSINDLARAPGIEIRAARGKFR